MESETALTTRPSSRIERHLAADLEKNQYPLVLVAPVKSELCRGASSLSLEFNLPLGIIAKDLDQEAVAQKTLDQISHGGGRIADRKCRPHELETETAAKE